MVTTSKNIQGNTELTLLAPLKTGLAPKLPVLTTDYSYPARLSLLLTTLFGDRKSELEKDRIVEGLLEELQVIHSVQWVIINQTEQPQLLLTVIFDGPWEPYIRTIVDKAGPLLDMIFSHCQGFEPNTCANGYQGFSRWVRSRQISTEFLFGATPNLTTDDARFLRQFESTFASDPGRSDLVRAASQTFLAPFVRKPSPAWVEKVLYLARLGFVFADEQQKFERMAALILLPEFGVLKDPGTSDAQGHAQSQIFQALLGSADPTMVGAMQWFQSLQSKLPQPPAAPAPAIDDRQDVQGSILTPYATTTGGATTHGSVALLRFRGKASGAEFLASMRNAVTTEPRDASTPAPEILVNLGLTYRGLNQLGLDSDLLARFPKEFQEGLEQRAGMLGDVGRNHPLNWELPRSNWPDQNNEGDPIPMSMVDAVLVLQTIDAAPGHELLPALAAHLDNLTWAVDVLHVQPTRRFDSGGHFGLEDGISQPAARGDASAAEALPRDQVALGELVLGYPNERGEVSELKPDELFKNSTFLALRNMSQDVEMYRALGSANVLALGRLASGVPLEQQALPPDPDRNLNDFSYPAAPNESRCPHFAHARRANPRTEAKVPRILRRGMSYGPKFSPNVAKTPRGVMFMAIAASLAEQYEVVQRWVNAGNSTGVLSAHPDLIAGPYPEHSNRKLYYSNALGTGQITIPETQLSVLKWGLYTFVPSQRAIEWLAQVAAGGVVVAEAPPPLLPSISYPTPSEVGPAPNALASPPAQFGAYALEPDSAAMQLKVFLEGGNNKVEAAAYWQGIQAQGGARITPFAVLVASQAAVQETLVDDEKYSVRSYWARMSACRANSFLGMDRHPVSLGGDGYETQVQGAYERESVANRIVGAISREEAFAPALAAGRAWLNQQRPILPGQPVALDLFAFGRRVIRDVAVKLFGLPDGFLSDAGDPVGAEGQVRCPYDLTTAFVHIFPPRPSAAVSQAAVEAGQRVAETTAGLYVSKDGQPSALEQSGFIKKLREERAKEPNAAESYEQSSAVEQRTLLGVLSGFAVPTNGHLVSVLVQLAESGELWRLQRELDESLKKLRPTAAGSGQNPSPVELKSTDVQFLYEPLYACMIRGAVPERLHRTALTDTTLGGVRIKKGDLLAVSIAAAAQEAAAKAEPDPWKLLFGDLPASQVAALAPRRPVHACPAQDVAIGVLLGALVAVLEHRPLARTTDPTVLESLQDVSRDS